MGKKNNEIIQYSKKILTVVIYFLAMFAYWRYSSEIEWPMVAIFLILAVVLINIDLENISEISTTGIKMRRETLKAEEINLKLQRNLEEFREAEKSILSFNLALIEKEGRFDMMVNPIYLANFVESSKRLALQGNMMTDSKIVNLLLISKLKTLEAFKGDINLRFPQISKQAEDFIGTGIVYSMSNGPS